jgi:hypothetical protein
MRSTAGRTDAVDSLTAGVRQYVHVIDPNGVYGLESARQALSLKKGCLPREIRLRRLRASKRGGRIMILGRWLIEWVEGGEISPRRPPALNGQTREALHQA